MPASVLDYLSAVERGDVDAVHRLLSSRAVPVDARDAAGCTALSLAALHGHAPVAELLLRAGADPNAFGAGGDTVLMWAASAGNTAICSMLLQHGASINAVNNKGYGALFRATYKNQAPCVRLLLAAGADVNQKTGMGSFSKTALDAARECGYTECARWLDGFSKQDAVEIERVRLEWPHAAANFITLPNADVIRARSTRSRSPSPVRIAAMKRG